MIRQYLEKARYQISAVDFPSFKRRPHFPNLYAEAENFAILCCVGQHLILTSVKASKSTFFVADCISIDLPTHLIGDYIVENPVEVSQIVLDLMEAIDLTSSPILLLLSSSKFRHHCFPINQISSWDLSDPMLRAKSPFLFDETYLQVHPNEGSFPDTKAINGVSYGNTRVVDSWLKVLLSLNSPVIGISPLYSGVIDWLSDTYKVKNNIIFCDVETSCCNLLFRDAASGYKTHQLPFGTSLYSDQSDQLIDQFFDRLNSSVEVIQGESDFDSELLCIISGFGLGAFGSPLTNNLGQWILFADLLDSGYVISDKIREDKIALNKYLFSQLLVSLSSYLYP